MKKIHFLTLSAGVLIPLVLFLLDLQSLSGWLHSAYAASPPEKTLVRVIEPAVTTSRLSREQILKDTWNYYKAKFMENRSRVVSNNYGGTITEGQSYALLKALWMNDPDTFARTWQWTKSNMKRPSDHLLGWRWSDGGHGNPRGLMETENATDADQDIAYALLLASRQWNIPAYREDGLAMVNDLWRLNVQHLDGQYYLLPGTWSGFKQNYLTMDPSYFAPYVYRTFARFDSIHAKGWNQLADGIYDTLESCSNLTRMKLPPNWCAVKWQDDHQGPRIIFSDVQGQGARDFGYDAFRVYWRMAMDAKLSPSPGRERAIAYLKRHAYLLQHWQAHRILPEGFSSTGQALGQTHSGFSAASALALNRIINPQQDDAFYQAVLAPYYHKEGYWFNDYNDFLHSVIWLHLYSTTL